MEEGGVKRGNLLRAYWAIKNTIAVDSPDHDINEWADYIASIDDYI